MVFGLIEDGGNELWFDVDDNVGGGIGIGFGEKWSKWNGFKCGFIDPLRGVGVDGVEPFD